MRGALLLQEALSTPWAIMPDRLPTILAVLARWSKGIEADANLLATIDADRAARDSRRGAAQRAGNGAIAVLPMYGIVAQRGGGVDDVSGPGVMSTTRFAAALRAALADETIGGIVIDVDSPGGSVYGVQELADEIYAARAQKPIYAVANTLAASAAYWLGSAASEFYVTPSGEVGSIGVYAAHEDWSKALDIAGIKTTLISAGQHKT
ncbi:MAG: S49 family peptidase, partial [Pseudomonadota bacterium]|nr:S49 family peptidase [Pseudomonadota bacterium]